MPSLYIRRTRVIRTGHTSSEEMGSHVKLPPLLRVVAKSGIKWTGHEYEWMKQFLIDRIPRWEKIMQIYEWGMPPRCSRPSKIQSLGRLRAPGNQVCCA